VPDRLGIKVAAGKLIYKIKTLQSISMKVTKLKENAKLSTGTEKTND